MIGPQDLSSEYREVRTVLFTHYSFFLYSFKIFCIKLNMAAGIFPDLSEINLMTEVFFTGTSGQWPESESVDQLLVFGGYSIGVFLGEFSERQGTGFVVKVLSSTSTARALILTASHIFIHCFEFDQRPLRFDICGDIYEVEPLKQGIDWDNEALYHIDSSSRNKMSVPDDWCLCTLTEISGASYKNPLKALDFCDSFTKHAIGVKVSVIGYPISFTKEDIFYIAPTLQKSDYAKIKKSLHDGSHPIKTEGEIMCNEETICITCVTCNGMSGSPLFIEENSILKVVGLLHGGPASPIHSLTARILNKTSAVDDAIVIQLIDYLKSLQGLPVVLKYEVKTYTKILSGILSKLLIFDEYVYKKLLDLYTTALVLEKYQGTSIKYNVAIPINLFEAELYARMNAFN